MPVITMPNESEEKQPWSVNRWAFRQLMERVADELQAARKLQQEIRDAQALDGLNFGFLDEDDGREVANAMLRAIPGLCEELSKSDGEFEASFVEALKQLQALIYRAYP